MIVDLGKVDQNETVITEQFRNLIGEMNKIIIYWTAYQAYPLQKVDPRKLDEKTEKVIDAIEHIKANDISETNNLLQAANT